MKIQKTVQYDIKNFDEHELAVSQSIFGLVPQDVYFRLDIDIDLDVDKNKLFNVYGLSGEGKTILKDELYKQLSSTHYVVDYDEINIGGNIKMSELFNLEKDKDFLVKLFASFGMFEMRNIFSRFDELSAGQQKRIKYMYLIYQAYTSADYSIGDVDCSNSVIMIDEFMTFVDSLSSKVFVQGLRKFMKKFLPNTLIFAFGCNDNIIGYWEDVTIKMQNGKISSIIEVMK